MTPDTSPDPINPPLSPPPPPQPASTALTATIQTSPRLMPYVRPSTSQVPEKAFRRLAHGRVDELDVQFGEFSYLVPLPLDDSGVPFPVLLKGRARVHKPLRR